MTETWLAADDGRQRSRRAFLAATSVAGAGLLSGCLGGIDGSSPDTESSNTGSQNWQSVELDPVRGGESFSIEGLGGPVVVQSFAVWCPSCQQQSNRLAALDDSITRVGLNTDPNEDAAKVEQHAAENGFDWRFAVAPSGMTESLVEEFGPTVTNAPSTPLVIVCDDGSTTFNAGSIDATSEIEAAVDEC